MAVTALALMAKTVFTITLYCWAGEASAPLKEGQNIQRKRVPTIAMSYEL